MDQKALEQAIIDAGLDDELERLRATIRPYARIRRAGKPVLSQLPAGTAKLGGTPDIRPGFKFQWPVGGEDSLPLPMIAQLPLAQVKAAQPALGIPERGYLYLFQGDIAEMLPPRAVAIYDPDATAENVASREEPEEYASDGWLITAELSAPIVFEGGWDAGLMTAEEEIRQDVAEEYGDAYLKLADEIVAPCDRNGAHAQHPAHKIGGFPDAIQGDVDRSGHLVLLCQIDSDDAMGWCFGDMGRLYYTGMRKDMASGKFKTVDLDRQCY